MLKFRFVWLSLLQFVTKCSNSKKSTIFLSIGLVFCRSLIIPSTEQILNIAPNYRSFVLTVSKLLPSENFNNELNKFLKIFFPTFSNQLTHKIHGSSPRTIKIFNNVCNKELEAIRKKSRHNLLKY